jgi:hypothetical protein
MSMSAAPVIGDAAIQYLPEPTAMTGSGGWMLEALYWELHVDHHLLRIHQHFLAKGADPDTREFQRGTDINGNGTIWVRYTKKAEGW